MIITYSPKYKKYQQTIRSRQVERAEKVIDNPGKKRKRKNQNDPARLIIETPVTSEGEISQYD